MQANNLNEIFIAFERLIKAGLVHLVVRTNDDVATAVESEIIIDYDYDPKAPVLKVIRNGVPTFLYTESDRLFREFQEKVFQIGTADGNDGYKPSIYFKLHNGTNENTGFDKDTITAFYNEFKNNPNLKPYLKHVKTPTGEHKLYPFTDTNHVYLDMSEIFSGVSDVKSISEVMSEFWNKLIEIRNELNTAITNLKTTMDNIVSDFNEVDKAQDALLKTLDDTNNANLDAIKNLTDEFNNLLANVEKAIRPMDFTLTHSSGDVVVPVLFTLSGGRQTGNIKELFLASLYIVDKDGHQMAKVGSDLLCEGGSFSGSNQNLDWVTKRNADRTMLYDFKQISNNQFVVLMRTGIYKIFNKYIEDLTIQAMKDGGHGYEVQPASFVYNKFINGPNSSGAIYRRFTSAIVVTDKLTLGNGFSLKVGR